MADVSKTPIDEAVMAGQHATLSEEISSERTHIGSISKAAATATVAGAVMLTGATIAGGGMDDPKPAFAAAGVGALLVGGGCTGAAIATRLTQRNEERIRRAQHIEQKLTSAGGRVPGGTDPYYTLPDGRRLVPQGPLADRLTFDNTRFDEPQR